MVCVCVGVRNDVWAKVRDGICTGVGQQFDSELKDTYQAMKGLVDRYVKQSAYSEISLDELFTDIFTLK